MSESQLHEENAQEKFPRNSSAPEEEQEENKKNEAELTSLPTHGDKPISDHPDQLREEPIQYVLDVYYSELVLEAYEVLRKMKEINFKNLKVTPDTDIKAKTQDEVENFNQNYSMSPDGQEFVKQPVSDYNQSNKYDAQQKDFEKTEDLKTDSEAIKFQEKAENEIEILPKDDIKESNFVLIHPDPIKNAQNEELTKQNVPESLENHRQSFDEENENERSQVNDEKKLKVLGLYLEKQRKTASIMAISQMIASNNVQTIIRGSLRGLPRIIKIHPETILKNSSSQNLARKSQTGKFLENHHDYKKEPRDSLKLSCNASLSRSRKRTDESEENEDDKIEMRTSKNNEIAEIDDAPYRNMQSMEVMQLKPALKSAKSAEIVIRPQVSFVFPEEKTKHTEPYSCQNFAPNIVYPTSPTNFPSKKKSSNFNKSSFNQLNNNDISIDPMRKSRKDEENKPILESETKVKAQKLDESEKNSHSEQGNRSSSKKVNESTKEANRNWPKKELVDFKPASKFNECDLEKSKIATDLIMRINLDKQARQAKIDKRQQKRLQQYQQDTLKDQHIAFDNYQTEMKNSRVEKIRQNIKYIQQRGEERRKANSRANNTIQKLMENASEYLGKPSLIEQAEENRRAIILAKIRNDHRPLQHEELVI